MSDYVVGLLAIARYCDIHLYMLYLYFLLFNLLRIAVKN